MLSWSILQYFWHALSDIKSVVKTIVGLLFELPLVAGITDVCIINSEMHNVIYKNRPYNHATLQLAYA